MNNIKFVFENGWFLLLLIPALFLAFFPYFRLNKKYRKNRNRIVSMVLHIITLSLVVLVLAGFRIVQSDLQLKNEVLIVVDDSNSNIDNEEIITNKVLDIVNNMTDDYEVGIISFAYDQHMVVDLTTNKERLKDLYTNRNININRNATNVSEALEFAASQFSDKNSGRIILITDALETEGFTLASARTLASEGVRIDVMYLPSKQHLNEVQIFDVITPELVQTGVEIPIDVLIDSRSSGDALIKLEINGDVIGFEDGTVVPLNGTTEAFSFNHVFYRVGLHEIKVTIKYEGDVIEENNVYYSFVNIEGSSNRLLIIDGTGMESTNLNNFISDEFDVTTITVSDLSLSSNNNILPMYDGVILMNVANSDLPSGFDQDLKYYVEVLGGGLFTVGGNKAYQEDDMQGSIFEEILPVYASTQAKSMAVMIVIDTSGSMVTPTDKLSLAKLGAEYSVLALDDSDYLGVVTFDTNARLIIEPTPVSRKVEIIDAINSIQHYSGTNYGIGLQMAKNQLDNFPGNHNFNKHVIFLTDGAPNDTDYMNIISQFGDISISTIALGTGHGVNHELVEGMVRVVDGRGSFYGVTNESELPSIMEAETLSVASEYTNIGVFEPYIYTRISPVASFITLPNLDGYYGTRIKTDATLVLSKDSDPIYAKRNYGNGVVGSFMSDLSGTWSASFIGDARGQLLVNNLIKDLLPESQINQSDLYLTFEQENFETSLRINSVLNEGETLRLNITNPNGISFIGDLNKQTDYVFTSSFESIIPGIYEFEITKVNSSNGVLATYLMYEAISYSKEYDNFYDEIEIFHFASNLASIGGGEILFETAGVFSQQSQTVERVINPTLALLITSLVLFLLNIIARKFKFKLPHELFKTKTKEK